VDLRTSTGFSALHYTAFWGHAAVVRALLTGGASVMLQTANGNGRGGTELMVVAGSNALHLCAENGHVMVAATLLMAHVSSADRGMLFYQSGGGGSLATLYC
jgi:phosphosulfolactate phosphohydrolase-like enzyme